jgi:hypothetical protein
VHTVCRRAKIWDFSWGRYICLLCFEILLGLSLEIWFLNSTEKSSWVLDLFLLVEICFCNLGVLCTDAPLLPFRG